MDRDFHRAHTTDFNVFSHVCQSKKSRNIIYISQYNKSLNNLPWQSGNTCDRGTSWSLLDGPPKDNCSPLVSDQVIRLARDKNPWGLSQFSPSFGLVPDHQLNEAQDSMGHIYGGLGATTPFCLVRLASAMYIGPHFLPASFMAFSMAFLSSKWR